MAGAPAYRFDAPVREPLRTPSPDVSVVRGRKRTDDVISDTAVTAIKAGIVLLLVLLVMGFAKVSIASAAYSVSSQASEVRAQINDAQTTGDSLAVQKSLVASPTNLRTQAKDKYGMAAPSSSETIVLSSDPVVVDSAGSLSLSGSVAALAQG